MLSAAIKVALSTACDVPDRAAALSLLGIAGQVVPDSIIAQGAAETLLQVNCARVGKALMPG